MSAAEARYVCIHGHFYQPPRENPWLDAIEVQDSAAPHHDWNERITRECYAPNSRARLLDGAGKIAGLLNNYAWMSFNFGPTLLAWMELEAPEVLHGIVEGDRLSRGRRRGHGNAIAQVYNHVIMPLASPRDQVTQVRCGIADFRQRFGHDPEGMWLAETAVDLATLEVLVDHGILFTILAPRQAHRWRALSGGEWQAIPEGIDPSRAYTCKLPSGRSIALFFYDGAIAREVAFERLLDSGEKFVARVKDGFDDQRTHAQLVHIATDGESYGHHHPHGDMALAHALLTLQNDPTVRLTNYGEYLHLHPPEWEVEIHEDSSWSCVHGVERWRSACGCAMRGDWQQQWRAPLRAGLDALKSALDDLFEDEGASHFLDPWAARDAYIQVLLGHRDSNVVTQYLADHGIPGVDESSALSLLEMQRHALLMFTSCAWFFDEISGLECTQCLCYAARALDLAAQFTDAAALEAEFLEFLSQAPSNLPELATGRAVWEQMVRPTRIDLERVLAHHAITSLFRDPAMFSRLYCYEITTRDHAVHNLAGLNVALGRLQTRSTLTLDTAEASYIALHFGGLDCETILRREVEPAEFERFRRKIAALCESGGSASAVAQLARAEFQGHNFGVEDLFAEELRRVIDFVLHDRFDDYQATFTRLAAIDADVLNRLGRMHNPIPTSLRVAASVVLDLEILNGVRELRESAALDRIRQALSRGRVWGFRPEKEPLAKELGLQLDRALETLQDPRQDIGLTGWAVRLLDAARLLGVALDLWHIQNQLLAMYAHRADAGALTPSVHQSFARLADRLNLSEALLGWRP